MPEDDIVMRPFVQIAAICQGSIQDVQGYLSLIKILDRLPVAGLTDVMRPQPLNQLTIAIVLKSGAMRGSYKWSLVVVTPSARRVPVVVDASALFEGDERGVAFVSPIHYVAEEEGLYWFEVLLEGSLLTKIPLRIMYQRIVSPPGFAPPQND